MCSIQRFPKRARGGFTMMELLIAIVISGILTTVVLQFLQGNSRFVRNQSAREEVQQNARAALDLIAAELRSAPPAALITLSPDSVRFRVPRAWGVLCNQLTTGSTTAWVLFPGNLGISTAVFDQPHVGIGVEQTADPMAPTGEFQFVPGPGQQTAGDPCAAIQPDLDPAAHLTLGFNNSGGIPYVVSGTLLPGTRVMLFEEMAYDVAQASSSPVPGHWIRRMMGRNGLVANMQPMAGPTPAYGALRFTYLQSDGITPTTDAQLVRRVRVQVIAQSRAERGSGTARTPEAMDTAVTEVYLRNVDN
jgi:prepilin-type N-terminal cleavage/methylation domain-containing protein